MNPIAIETIGYLAAAANVFVFVSNTMIPLRIAAIAANALFAVYFFIDGYYGLCALNAFLLPVNLMRLKQMRDLVDHMRRANSDGADTSFDYEWLRPYMRTIKLPAGFTLHYRGDLADEAYVLLRGDVRLFEPGVILKPVAFFGEMGMFTDENRRTATAIAETGVELLAIRYEDLLQLAAQDPEFSFYLMRLMMRRMQHNLEIAENAGAWRTRIEPPASREIHER
jgi:CRP-like cAMP-binding protein